MLYDEKIANAILGLLKLRSGSHLNNFKKKSRHVLDFLLKVFNECRYPSMETIEDISMLIRFPPKRIQIWFQNKRNNLKKTEIQTRVNKRLKNNVSTTAQNNCNKISASALLEIFQEFLDKNVFENTGIH